MSALNEISIAVVTALSEAAAVEVSVVIVVHAVAMEGLHRRTLPMKCVPNSPLTKSGPEGALPHHAASETYTCQKVGGAVVETDVVIDPATAVDLLPLGDLGRLSDVAAVRLPQAVQGVLPDDLGEHLRLTALDLRLVAPAAPLQGLPCAVIGLGATTGRSRQAMIAEGCADLALDLLHQGTSQAHHRSGCRARDLEARRAVDEAILNHDHPIPGLFPQHLSE